LEQYGFEENLPMNDRKKAKCFVDSEIYKDKIEELLQKRKIMLIMVCNSIVLRINHINSIYQSYMNSYNKYHDEFLHGWSAYSEEFLLAEEIVYHSRKVIDEMIYSLWMYKVGISNINNAEYKCIDSIGKYLSQDVKILTEFDDYLGIIKDINVLSNSYKHSICTFDPIETDLSHMEEPASFWSYIVRERDRDVKVIQEDLLKTVDKMFERFLESI